MALKAVLTEEAWQKLAKELQAEYTKDQKGRYVLAVEPVEGFSLEDVAGLKTSLGRERTTREEFERRLKDLEGLDPAKAREALAKLEEMKNWSPEEKVREQVAARERALTEKYQGEVAKAQEKLTKAQAALERNLKTAAATAAIAKAKGVPELLLPHVLNRLKVVPNGDDYGLKVLGMDGNPMVSMRQGHHGDATVEELVELLKADATFGRAFEGAGSAGGGTTPLPGGNGGAYRITEDDARDPGKYQAAREAAQKAGKGLPEIVR